MHDQVFSEADILRVLSEEWLSFELITTGLDINKEYDLRWLALKLKNLVKSGELKVDSISGIKFWKKYKLIELYPDYKFQIKKYKSLLTQEPENYQTLSKLAKIYNKQSEYEKAINLYKKYFVLNSEEPKVIFGLIEAYYSNGDLFDAFDILKNQQQIPSVYSYISSIVLMDVGYFYLNEDEDKAFEMFCDAVEAFYENDNAYYEIGLIEFNRKKFKEAAKNFRGALEFTGEEISPEEGVKRWKYYINAMHKAKSLDEALSFFELSLSTAFFEIEYWEYIIENFIEFDKHDRGIIFLENFLKKEIDTKEFYDDHDKNTLIILRDSFYERTLGKVIQEALSFYLSVASDCTLKDIQDYIRERHSFLEIEKINLKIKTIELIKNLQLKVRFREGIFLSIDGKYDHDIQLLPSREIEIKIYIGNLAHQLLPKPTNKNIELFAKEMHRFTDNLNEYEKIIVKKELNNIMEGWDKLKPPTWKKILKELVKLIPGLIPLY